MSVLRSASAKVNLPRAQHWTDDQVLVHVELPALEAKLAVLRFATLARMVRFATPPVVRMVLLAYPAKRSWLAEVEREARRLYALDARVQAWFKGSSP